MLAGNQNVQRKPCNTVNCEKTNIFYRCPHVPGRQGHNAVKGGMGWNDVTNDCQRTAYPDQSAYNGYCNKHKHDDLDIDHADHQSLGKFADKQPDQRRHKGRQNDQRKHYSKILPGQSETDTRRYNRGQTAKEKAHYDFLKMYWLGVIGRISLMKATPSSFSEMMFMALNVQPINIATISTAGMKMS